MTFTLTLTGLDIQRGIADAVADFTAESKTLLNKVEEGLITSQQYDRSMLDIACYTIGRVKFYAVDVEVKA